MRQRLANPVTAAAPSITQAVPRYVALDLLDDDIVIGNLSSEPMQTVWIAPELPVAHQLMTAAWATAMMLAPPVN